jgi:two-component system response regulator FixJ
MDGLEVQKRMPEAGIDFPVIILTGHGEIAMAVKAMQNGAIDFISKPFEREHLLRAIDRALGQAARRESLLERENWALAQIARLTDREREVLDGLACGYPNKTIAYDLGISSRTVEVYRANIMVKMHVSNFADALRIAFAGNLGSDENWRRTHGLAERPSSSSPTDLARAGDLN